MRAETRGRHRRSTPAAWPRAWVLSLAVLLVAGAFGVGELVSEVGDDKAGADTPAIIRPSADTQGRADRRRKGPERHEVTTVDRTPRVEPDTPSTTPEVRALRTSRRDTGRAADERGVSGPRSTASPSEEPSAEPTAGPSSDPADEATQEPSDEPTQEPSDDPTADDDDLLPILPDNGPDKSRTVRPAKSSKRNRGGAGSQR